MEKHIDSIEPNELECSNNEDNLKLICKNSLQSSNDELNACTSFDEPEEKFISNHIEQNTPHEAETQSENLIPVASASGGLEKLLQKQKLELTLELRRLQFSNRPVTNQETKDRLQEFFSSNQENSSVTRNPAQFRTELMRGEIESLSSQRRVSTVLQTARQTLENTLQRYVNVTARRDTTPVVVNTTTQSSQSTLNQSSAYVNGLHNSQNSIHSVQSNSSSNIVIQSSDGSTNVFAPVTAWIPVTQNNNTNNVSQPNNANNVPQVAANQPALIVNQGISQNPWANVNTDALRNTIEHLRREQIIDEISELVHHQLVTSTLESQFRQRLERHVLENLERTGTNGERTRNYIRNLTQSERIERNDFSNLGILTNPTQNAIIDNLDSASTFHEHQMQRATATNSREIKHLQSEISELKNMMKLSFELQLDMQRSLKQEISALISGALNQNNNNNNQQNATSYLTATRPSNEGQCVICTDGKVDTVFYQCGHMCTCYTCSMTLKQRGSKCPVCRAPIKDIVRTYKCNLE